MVSLSSCSTNRYADTSCQHYEKTSNCITPTLFFPLFFPALSSVFSPLFLFCHGIFFYRYCPHTPPCIFFPRCAQKTHLSNEVIKAALQLCHLCPLINNAAPGCILRISKLRVQKAFNSQRLNLESSEINATSWFPNPRDEAH